MKKSLQPEAAQATNIFQFTLTGLIIFSLAMIGGASFVTYKLTYKPQVSVDENFAVVDPKDKSSSLHGGPWGELGTRDIELERPVEYLTDEVQNPAAELWTFKGMSVAGVKALLEQKGVATAQVEAAFAPANFSENSAGTTLRPPLDFLLSLGTDTRQKLYTALDGAGVNLYLDYPYIFPKDTIESIYADNRLNPDDAALLKQLVYSNGSAKQLSDYQALLEKIPTAERRIAMARALSRQSAVLARVVIRPDTDIDKIAAYWGNAPNVRFTDIRPLFESLKALPEGGSVNLIYLLPPFARNRLYTFPLPPQPGDPVMDCHWTTFNFGNEIPDNHFNDPAYTIKYINQYYYQIAAPTIYGDILLLMNDKNEIKHSAVYLADDLVFTKNGNNYRQPWMIMHIPDLLATYPDNPPMRPVYIRRKVD